MKTVEVKESLTTRFKNAYDALVKAYFNNHLEYSDCAMCAVGNIIAHSNGYEIADTGRYIIWIKPDKKRILPKWPFGLVSMRYGKGEAYEDNQLHFDVKNEISKSKYSMKELALIEKEFSRLNEELVIQKIKNHECLYLLIEFIASLDGDTLEFEENPFELNEMKAYEMVK